MCVNYSQAQQKKLTGRKDPHFSVSKTIRNLVFVRVIVEV